MEKWATFYVKFIELENREKRKGKTFFRLFIFWFLKRFEENIKERKYE